MVFWFKSWLFGAPSPTSSNDNDYDTPGAENLIGLWDFNDGAGSKDTGTADGIAQNGRFEDDAEASHGALHTDGKHDHFDVSGTVGPFDLQSGTIETEFTQHEHVGSSPDTIVNRGEYHDRDDEGYFGIQVTEKGAVEVLHYASGKSVHLSTPDHFFDEGDDVRVAYSWDATSGVNLVVQNVSTGETYADEKSVTGLNLEIGDNDDENFTFGAREEDGGDYDRFFDGQINYVAVFDKDLISKGDGIVTGSAGDDEIDVAYTGDPEGDLIDAGDALLSGEAPDDDIVDALDGDDTVLAGEGNDDVYAGSGNDSVEGGNGDDLIYGDCSYDRGILPDDGADLCVEKDTHGKPIELTLSYVGLSTAVDTKQPDDKYEIGDILGADSDTTAYIEVRDGSKVFFSGEVTEGSSFTAVGVDGKFGANTEVKIYDQAGGSLLQSLEFHTSCSKPLAIGDQFGSVVLTGAKLEDGFELGGGLVTDDGVDGNDTLLGGDGEDTVFAGGGDDSVEGGNGDDLIYGDSSCDDDDTGRVRESFEWDKAPDPNGSGPVDDGDNLSGGFTQNTGSVDVTFSVTDADAGVTTEFADNQQKVHSIVDDGSGVDAHSSIESVAGGKGKSITYALDFSDDVENVSFRVNDIDGDGVVTIKAFNGTTPVDVSISGGSKLTLLDTDGVAGADTADSKGDYEDDTSPNYSVLVDIAGPITSLEITHGQNGSDNSGVNITDVYFDTVSDLGGDDTLVGDDGDDTILGEAGSDLLVGGASSDDMSGGDGNDTFTVGSAAEGAGDVVVGGNGPDQNTDNDTLDLRGAGRVDINASTDATDAGAQSGIVTFGDGSELTFSQIETILTDPQNDGPVAVDDPVETDEDTALTFDPAANDTDADGDTLTVTGVEQPSNGTVTLNGDGTVTYTPNENYNGPDSFDYTVDDGNGGTDTGTVFITVNPVNDDPVANDDAETTPFNTPTTVDVLVNDTDVDGDTLTVTSATVDPRQGEAVVNGDNTITFTPVNGFEGEAEITYEISDGNGGTDTAVLTVTVEEQPLDDIVEGTAGDDLINVNYEGDPEGDKIDNNDALGFWGEPVGSNDDSVQAGAGKDSVLAGDGDDTVIGEEGDDTLRGEDGNDNLDGGDGSDSVSGAIGDDTVLGGAGEDLLRGGSGDDSLDGGTENDTLDSGSGNDTLIGGEGDDDITAGVNEAIDVPTIFGVPVDGDPNDDLDFVDAGAGNDTISTGDDADTILAGDGDDVVEGGIDDDEVFGGAGNDSITDQQGSDFIDGGTGDDTVIAGVDTFSDYENDPNLPAPLNPDGSIALVDLNVDDGKDTVLGGEGNDLIATGDDADSIDGGTGNDTIDAGIDDDIVTGGDGADEILGGDGSDTIDGGEGEDFIDASSATSPNEFPNAPDATDPIPENDRDVVQGGAGNDTILTGDDDDSIDGGDGDDLIDGGIDEDTIDGGLGNDSVLGGAGDDEISGSSGDDTIDGGEGDDAALGGEGDDLFLFGEGADTLSGGNGRDTFLGGNDGDVVDGGTGGDDVDTLDLTGFGNLQIVGETVDADGDSTSGTVEFLDGAGSVTGSMTFAEIENVIPCFTPGTVIATPKGERLVEDLQVGDRVITRDNGIQEIRWLGKKALTGQQLVQNSHLKPILIRAGSLGNGLPERDMLVSPNHRVLVNNDKTALYFEEREVLVAAKHLTGIQGVDEVETSGTTYIHFMFDHHEVVLSNGAWTESFQPGDYTLKGIGNAQRTEILELFPELASQEGIEAYQSARRALKKHEAKLLID